MDRQLLRPFSPVLAATPGATSFAASLAAEFYSSSHEDRMNDEWTDPSPELDDNWDPRTDRSE